MMTSSRNSGKNLRVSSEIEVNKVMEQNPSVKKTGSKFVKGADIKLQCNMKKMFFAIFSLALALNVSGQVKPIVSKNVVCDCSFQRQTFYEYEDLNKQYKILIEYSGWDNERIKQSGVNGYFSQMEYSRKYVTGVLERNIAFKDNLKYYGDYGKLYKIEYKQEPISMTEKTIGVSNSWVREDVGIYSDIIYKKPFDTYVNESKNFDVMFGLKETSKDISWSPFLVVKNYFQRQERESINNITLMIGDEKIEITKNYDGFGRTYSKKELTVKNGTTIVGYRTVTLPIIPFNDILHWQDSTQRMEYLTNISKKAIQGKVSLIYETMTGKVTRNFSEVQINSFKELIKIYIYFLNNKNKNEQNTEEIAYKNDQIKQKCENIKTQVLQLIEVEKAKFDLSKIDSIISVKKIELDYQR